MRTSLDIIDRLADLRERYSEAEQKDGWTWKRGISLYRNPEFFCPRCKTWDETKLIWLVDEDRRMLLGVWHMDGRSAYPSFTYIHPHVSGGSICIGNATSAAAALFASIHPDNPYHDINTWLIEIGHVDRCSYFPKAKCDWCGNENQIVLMTVFGSTTKRVCATKCLGDASKIRCVKCFLDRDPSMDYRRDSYCRECFDLVAYSCLVCEEKWASSKTKALRDGRVCPECYENKKRRCGDCKKNFLIKELDNKGRCLAFCKRIHCNYCGTLKKIGERDDRGYCADCQKAYLTQWTCECSTCNCETVVDQEGVRCSDCEQGDHNE